jgi:non-specific serine/threonine protein kinase
LIILDNIEVHVDACASLVRDLLSSCPTLGILTTGREPLRIAGEHVVQLAPLQVPPVESADTLDAKRWPAVRLFLDRVFTARPDIEFDDDGMAAVVGICRRLEGLPLAIEIAAARATVLDPVAILHGLDDMYHLLRTNDRSLPVRQRTMQSLLDWSHRLLSVPERAALRRLSVFGGGFSIEAAVAAVSDNDIAAEDVAELVWSLVDQSLARTDLAANATRYRFLETVRQYGRRQLEAAGETNPVAARLAGWYLEQLGPGQSTDRAWLGNVAMELDNLRAGVPIVAATDQAVAQQLTCVIGRYMDATQSFTTGIDELTRLAALLLSDTSSRVALLAQLAHLYLRVGLIDSADELIRQAADVGERTGAPDWDDVCVSRTLGEIAIRKGDDTGAAAIAEHALRGSISLRGRARMWNLMGLANSRMGKLEEAASNFENELDEHRRAGNEAFVAGAAGNLAEIALRQGDFARAAQHQRLCLDSALSVGLPVNIAYSLVLAARLASEKTEWELAAQLASKAEAMLSEAAHEMYPDDRREFEQLSSRIRLALAPDQFGKVGKSVRRCAGRGLRARV